MSKEFQQEILKNRITDYLKKNNLSINRLAELSNIRQSTLNNIINRGTIPRIDTIQAICEGLHISVKDFFDFPPYNEIKNNEDSKNSQNELTQKMDILNKKLVEMEKELKELRG